MPKPKCMYKSTNDNQCCRSTCEHHCKVVTDEICNQCILHQDKPTIGDKQRFKIIIKEVIELLNVNDVEYAKKVLNKAMTL